MKVSVALITYNRPQFLNQAINSILNQTFTEFEFLILDNGSDEETKKLILKFNDKRIRYIRNPKNQREFYNVAFKEAKGEYLLIAHDDDIMLPDFLTKEVEAMEKYPESIVISCNACSIDKNNKILFPNLLNLNKTQVFEKYQYISHFIHSRHGIICPTALMRKEYFLSHDLDFNFLVGPAADNYLWIKCNLSNNTLIIIPEILYKYRIHDNQDSLNNKISMDTKLYESLLILFNEEKLYNFLPIVSLKLIINHLKSLQKGLISKIDLFEKLNQINLCNNSLIEKTILKLNKAIIIVTPFLSISFLKVQNRIRIFFFNKLYFENTK